MHMTQTSCHLAQTCLDLSGNKHQAPKEQIQEHRWNALFCLPGMVYMPGSSFPTWQPLSYPSGLSLKVNLSERPHTTTQDIFPSPIPFLYFHVVSCSFSSWYLSQFVTICICLFACSLFFSTTHSINKH